MDIFEPYSHALASLALWALLVSVLAAVSTRGRTSDRAPCGKPNRNYADPVYRRERAFMNAVETSGPFVAATLAAILAGAPAFWVNLLASVFVLARLAMAVIHVRTVNETARSVAFMVGLVCILGLVSLGLVAAF